MPTAFSNGDLGLSPHIEMWGYHVLSCLTAFDEVRGTKT